MPDVLILVSVLIGLALLFLYKSVVKLPLILYLFLVVYNTLPYMSYRYLGGTIYFADYSYVDYAYLIYVLGLCSYLTGCIGARFLTAKISYEPMPVIHFSYLKLVSYSVFFITLAGVILTGQINHLGSYGGGDPAHTKFATLMHFTLIFNIIFCLYIYLLTSGIDKKYLKYQSFVMLILFLVIGNRSVVVGIVLVSAWYVSSQHKNLFRDVSGLAFLFIMLVGVQSFRGAGHLTGNWLEGARLTIDKLSNQDLWVYLLSVQSDNFGVLSYVIGKMEQVEYYLGYTYLESLVRLIPGPIRRIAGINDEGEIFNHIEFLGYDGIAFNLMAEIYMNFSIAGIIFLMFLIGFSIAYLSDMAEKRQGYYMIFMLNMYSVISTLARNDSALSIKQFVYTSIILFILLAVFGRKRSHRNSHENIR